MEHARDGWAGRNGLAQDGWTRDGQDGWTWDRHTWDERTRDGRTQDGHTAPCPVNASAMPCLPSSSTAYLTSV